MRRASRSIDSRSRRSMMIDGYDLVDRFSEQGAWDAWRDRRPRRRLVLFLVAFLAFFLIGCT
jgi:hypothetical protein